MRVTTSERTDILQESEWPVGFCETNPLPGVRPVKNLTIPLGNGVEQLGETVKYNVAASNLQVLTRDLRITKRSLTGIGIEKQTVRPVGIHRKRVSRHAPRSRTQIER